MNNFNAIKQLVLSGHAVEIKKLSICRINDYYKSVGIDGPHYQVHCDDYRVKDEDRSVMHQQINKAVAHFIRLSRTLYEVY